VNSKARRALLAAGLSAGLAAGALRFVLRPDAASPAGAALFVSEVLILFALGLRYAIRVESRRAFRTAAFLTCLVILVWAAETVSMKTGLLGGGYIYGAALLRPGLGGVPLLVLLSWALFGLLSGSITRVLVGEAPRDRSGRPSRLPALGLAVLVNGAVMLGIDLAVEWHFSGAAGFWTWRSAEGSPMLLNGIPPGNFILWFAVGCVVPLVERLTGAEGRESQGESKPEILLRTAPALGFALLLFAGVFLDLAAGAPIGALACGAGFLAVAARLVRLSRPARRGRFRVSG
jgi:uncharacterized membrane protein